MRLQLKMIVCLALAVCLLTATAALAKDSKCKWWPPREPRPVAVTNTPNVNVTNTPGVWVVNDGANPVPVVVQNPAAPSGGGGLSEVVVVNGPDEPLPVQQAATHHSIFLSGMMSANQSYLELNLHWPAGKAFLVKTVVLWGETGLKLYFPVNSEIVANPYDFIWLAANEAGRPKVENLHGGILLRESGISCRLDKAAPDGEFRQYRLLITGELLPK